MAIRVRYQKPATRGGWLRLFALFALAGCAVVALLGFAVGAYFYITYQPMVEARLKEPLFATTAKIYAAPREVRPGQHLTLPGIVNELRQAGYTEDGASNTSPVGTFTLGPNYVNVRPGPQSYHSQDVASIHFANGLVDSMSDDRGQSLSSYELEPLLITGLSEDVNRTKRRLITYDEIPANLVQAVLAIEDRRFFEHNGVNVFRLLEAGIRDVRSGQKQQGGSTLTMQLARGFFLSPEKRLKRKLIEIVITLQLEHRFNKQQIFEMYANQINLGQRGSFSITGFGEASQAYFGKDIKQLNLAECATLAGMIQRPNYFSPYRHADRTMDRRNLVLDSMVETGAITKDLAERTKAEPLKVSAQSVDASDAPYFVDLVREQLNQKLGDRDFNREGLHIYTSLDPDLQRAATWAVENTVHEIDAIVDKMHPHHQLGENVTYPQVALVALNPHTGQVLALVGGRSYGISQLNHAVAKRPTGSIFKPFVYAAALTTGMNGTHLSGHEEPFSQISIVNDEQTTFEAYGQPYSPHNDKDEYFGPVTARFALQKSLNNATISLASLVGYDNVASLARDAGVHGAKGTPAMAIGAYDATPLEMAGAYTIFANSGLRIDPWMVASVRSPQGDVITDFSPVTKQLLDPRVAFVTTDMLENVIDHGTGYEARRRGFTVPAAGKTGSSHDAWFAGYTSNLLCVVWVGNDDYTDVKIHGAQAAAPIWAEFMKRAIELPQYSDTNSFTPPDGVQMVTIDKATSLPADAGCSGETYEAAFVEGTVPMETCSRSSAQDHRNFFQKIFGGGKKQ